MESQDNLEYETVTNTNGFDQTGGYSDAPQHRHRYRTILADPPWNIEQGGTYGAVHHYDLMPLNRIKALPVADLVENSSHCWIWVTNATLRHGFDVLETWGFKPRSVFTWIKPRLGLGVYLRNATEHVLLGTRGKAPVLFKAQPNWLFAPLQGHSHKPEELYQIIQRVSPAPYLELFARRNQPGWDAWGNEIESDIDIAGYPVPKLRAGVIRHNAVTDITNVANDTNAAKVTNVTNVTDGKGDA